MIPVSDLRKGNLVKTEFGILPVHHIVFSDIYVQGKDGRVLYAREVEGVEFLNGIHSNILFLNDIFRYWRFVHEFQNYYYWSNRKELKIDL